MDSSQPLGDPRQRYLCANDTTCSLPFHRLLVIVLHHQVLVKEAKRLLRGGSSQANQVGVEVFQHLAPEVVDPLVAGTPYLISGSTGSTIMAHSPAAADTLSLGVTKWVA